MFEEIDPNKLFPPPRESLLDVSIPVKTRIKYPIVWTMFPDVGVRITDLREDKYEEALQHIKTVYFHEAPLCRSLELLDDEESTEAFLADIRSHMNDTQSMIALKEDTNEIVGVIVTRVYDCLAMKTFDRMSFYKGESFNKIQRFRNHFFKHTNMKELYGTDAFNYVYIMSVDPAFRRLGIGSGLLEASIKQTKLFNVDVICAIFTSHSFQSLAERKLFKDILFEVYYSQWIEDDEIVFSNPGPNNYSAIFMGRYLPDEFQVSEDSIEEGEENKYEIGQENIAEEEQDKEQGNEEDKVQENKKEKQQENKDEEQENKDEKEKDEYTKY